MYICCSSVTSSSYRWRSSICFLFSSPADKYASASYAFSLSTCSSLCWVSVYLDLYMSTLCSSTITCWVLFGPSYFPIFSSRLLMIPCKCLKYFLFSWIVPVNLLSILTLLLSLSSFISSSFACSCVWSYSISNYNWSLDSSTSSSYWTYCMLFSRLSRWSIRFKKLF